MKKNKVAYYVDDSDLFVYKISKIIESVIKILKQEKIIWKSVGVGESIDYL